MGSQPPPSSTSPHASLPFASSDAATLMQEKLDCLALATFNAVLFVSRAERRQTLEGGHSGKASQLGYEIGTLLREIEEVIEILPVIPPLARGADEQTNSVVETQKRLKELQAEYERVHHELRETVSEAGTMSKKLRNILVYYK
ncbi:Hypothetical protein NocV09_02100920 [Nannochloropsis oceanica]